MQSAGVQDSGSSTEDALMARFGADSFVRQATADGTPTLWVEADRLIDVLESLKPD